LLYQGCQSLRDSSRVVIGCPRTASLADKFKAKHRLAVTLVTDEDIKVAEAYGVWVEKSMYGRRYMG